MFVSTGAKQFTVLCGSLSAEEGSFDGQFPLARFNRPTHICFADSARTLYVYDSLNSRLRAIDIQSGVVSTFAGNRSVAVTVDTKRGADWVDWQSISAICYDHLWNCLYCCDGWSHTVWKVSLRTGALACLSLFSPMCRRYRAFVSHSRAGWRALSSVRCCSVHRRNRLCHGLGRAHRSPHCACRYVNFFLRVCIFCC